MIHHTNHPWSAAIAFAFLLGLPGIAAAAGDHDGGHGHDAGGERQQQDNHHDDGHGEHGMAGDDHHGDNMHGEGHGGNNDGHGHGGGGHSVGFGRPAKASEADRTVRITALDTMRFKPASIHVEAGETVRFVVENPGSLQHSFTLGTPSAQRKHEKEMRGMPIDKMAGHMRNDPTGMVIQPGATDSLTWHFKQGGPVQFACHIPGHYEAGMTGRIRIE